MAAVLDAKRRRAVPASSSCVGFYRCTSLDREYSLRGSSSSRGALVLFEFFLGNSIESECGDRAVQVRSYDSPLASGTAPAGEIGILSPDHTAFHKVFSYKAGPPWKRAQEPGVLSAFSHPMAGYRNTAQGRPRGDSAAVLTREDSGNRTNRACRWYSPSRREH